MCSFNAEFVNLALSTMSVYTDDNVANNNSFTTDVRISSDVTKQ